jgi:RNA binding exosome subunit
LPCPQESPDVKLGVLGVAAAAASTVGVAVASHSTMNYVRISDALREFLTDRELVEVLQVTGYYWTFGRISTVLDVEVTKVYGGEPLLDTPDG